MAEYTKAQLTEMIVGKLRRNFGRDVDDATPNHMFKACALVLRDIMSSHQMATVEEFCTDIVILNRSKTVLQGNLNEIKKSYGRINLSLKTEKDISAQIAAAGVQVLTEKEYEYELRVTGEQQANDLLSRLIADGVPMIRFDLREPSLHEIFVEKVGGSHGDA